MGQPCRSSCGGCSAWRTRSRWRVTDPIQDDRSWRFNLDPGGRDPVLGIRFLQEAYDSARSRATRGGISVPAVVDVPSGQLVTNDFQQITLDLATEWRRPPAGRARPVPGAPARRDRRGGASGIYRDVNNGVYRCRFRHHAAGLRRGVPTAFAGWTGCRSGWRDQRYLVGDTITEADVRLFTTLARFDAVYHGHFKCNRSKLSRDAGAVGVRARPVPDTGVRRHGRLRPHQAALLRRTHRTSTPPRSCRPDQTCPAG